MRFSCGALRRLLIRSPWSLIDFLDSASFQTDSQIVAIDRLESRFLQILNTDIIDAVIQYSVIRLAPLGIRGQCPSRLPFPIRRHPLSLPETLFQSRWTFDRSQTACYKTEPLQTQVQPQRLKIRLSCLTSSSSPCTLAQASSTTCCRRSSICQAAKVRFAMSSGIERAVLRSSSFRTKIPSF